MWQTEEFRILGECRGRFLLMPLSRMYESRVSTWSWQGIFTLRMYPCPGQTVSVELKNISDVYIEFIFPQFYLNPSMISLRGGEEYDFVIEHPTSSFVLMWKITSVDM